MARNLLILCLAVLFASSLPAQSNPVQAEVIFIDKDGESFLIANGKVAPLMIGDGVRPGEVIRTRNTNLELLLPHNGSILKLGIDTTFSLNVHSSTLAGSPDTMPALVFGISAGSVRATLARTANSEYAWRTQAAVLGVRGTDLVVEAAQDGDMVISVLSGLVEAFSVSSPEGIIVSAGKEIQFTDGFIQGVVRDIQDLARLERFHRYQTVDPAQVASVDRPLSTYSWSDYASDIEAAMLFDRLSREWLEIPLPADTVKEEVPESGEGKSDGQSVSSTDQGTAGTSGPIPGGSGSNPADPGSNQVDPENKLDTTGIGVDAGGSTGSGTVNSQESGSEGSIQVDPDQTVEGTVPLSAGTGLTIKEAPVGSRSDRLASPVSDGKQRVTPASGVAGIRIEPPSQAEPGFSSGQTGQAFQTPEIHISSGLVGILTESVASMARFGAMAELAMAVPVSTAASFGFSANVSFFPGVLDGLESVGIVGLGLLGRGGLPVTGTLRVDGTVSLGFAYAGIAYTPESGIENTSGWFPVVSGSIGVMHSLGNLGVGMRVGCMTLFERERIVSAFLGLGIRNGGRQ